MSNQEPVIHRLAAPRVAFGLVLVLLSWGLLVPAAARLSEDGPAAQLLQEPTLLPRAAGPRPSAETLEARLAEARANLAALAPDAAAWTNAPPEFRRRTFCSAGRCTSAWCGSMSNSSMRARNSRALKNRKAELVRQAQTWTGFSEPRPYSVLLTDNLREEIQAERLKVKQWRVRPCRPGCSSSKITANR